MTEPDTYEELIEALKQYNYDQDCRKRVSEFRYFMCKMGDPFEE